MSSSKKGRLVDALAGTFCRIASSLGFRLIPELPRGRHDYAWWYLREGKEFRSELIAFRLRRNPRVQFVVYYYGSPLSLEDLQHSGFAGNTAGRGLADYQMDFLERASDEVLPGVIEVLSEENLALVEARLQDEMTLCDRRVWPDLWRAAKEVRPDWEARDPA
jgi:hypothetical protein